MCGPRDDVHRCVVSCKWGGVTMDRYRDEDLGRRTGDRKTTRKCVEHMWGNGGSRREWGLDVVECCVRLWTRCDAGVVGALR